MTPPKGIDDDGLLIAPDDTGMIMPDYDDLIVLELEKPEEENHEREEE